MSDEFVFAALGGLGEIGRNAALYGFGPKGKRKWLMVDCGLSFAGPELPGVDLVFPDVSFVEKIRKDLLGLVITHAHEDHIGAIAALWPRLGCKVYATRFAIGLLEARRLGEPGAPKVDLVPMEQGRRFTLGPFEIEPIAMAHSIPESCALALRTPAGLAVHTGDWKIDPEPGVGAPTNEARLREIGDEGVDALICDSTNIVREGASPSEGEVARTLAQVIANSAHRVVVTTFASNLARIKAVALAAQAAGRSVVVVGRSLDRVIAVGRECGYLDGVKPFLSQQSFGDLARDKIVVIATGSQGEPRAAMARIGLKEHPSVKLAPGDRVIFSSRTIPGNERDVNAIINELVDQGVDVVTDRNALVHCSGHPRQDEVARLYALLRPRLLVPAHGEPLHLEEHARFGRAHGVPHVLRARDGDVARLAPDPAIIDEIPTGRIVEDGFALIGADDEALAQRRRLSFAGVVSLAIAVNRQGDMVGDPDVVISGAPARGRDNAALDETVDEAIFSTFEGLPRGRRRDADALAQAIERAVRGALANVWGKKPQV
ncbi:MAG: ribonuclease J, partial [Hyphomicrobiales bacterium]|nr:ribonuclease J [Hyphomicrobiales bacterium]